MIVGVDVSSRRIDLAWLENNRPCRWHQELAKGHLIDRLRSIRVEWPSAPGWGSGCGVSEIAIEYPYSPRRNAIAALMATTGIITRQAPPWARVAWPSSGELRTAIGAANNKKSAHWALDQMFSTITSDGPTGPIQTVDMPLLGWDEHELDALTACIGWTRILQAQDTQ